MIKYSIADLESITGIKAHTIRIWEKRYSVIKPSRTSTNIRYYNNDDMRKMINIASLLKSGMKISKISQLNANEMAEEINRRLATSKSEDVIVESLITQIINAGLSFYEIAFDKAFSGSILKLGLVETYIKVIVPVLNRVGMLWSTDHMNPAQEHFISNLIRQKLFAAIDTLPHPNSTHDKILLFLPDFEDHEIGLLMANYLLKQNNRPTIYLGRNVPLNNVIDAIRECKPNKLLFFIIQSRPDEFIVDYLNSLVKEFKNQKIYLAGNMALLESIDIPKNIALIQTFDSLLDEL